MIIKFTGMYETDWTGFEFTWKQEESPGTIACDRWRVMPVSEKVDSEWAIAPITEDKFWVNDKWHRQWHWFSEAELMELLIYQLQERLSHLDKEYH